MKKIYTEKFRCAVCHKIIAEYSKNNRERVIKSWVSVCNSCFIAIEKQIALIREMDLRIIKLEQKVI